MTATIAAVAGLQFGARPASAATRHAPDTQSVATAQIHHLRGTGLKLPVLSVAAQERLAQKIGAHDPAYRAQHRDGALEVLNAAQHLRATFTRSGVTVRRGVRQLSLGLLGARPAAPVVSANRVSYRAGSITQTFTNSPLGLEQSFLVTRPQGAGQLTLELKTNAGAGPVLTRQGYVTFRGSQGLGYGKLNATDARGRSLAARLTVRHGELRISVATRGASFPVTVDPSITDTQEFDGSDPTNGAFGTSVAMSGSTLVVGDPGVNGGEGAVYVYTEGPGGWMNTSPPAVLTAPNPGGGDAFGTSVAIDGPTIVVGATGASDPISGSNNSDGDGAAYVFTEPAGGWQTTSSGMPLGVANPSGSDDFGISVAVSGTTVVVGADQSGGAAANGGVFVYTNLTHPIPGNFLSDGGTGGDEFGTSVAISGQEIVVGAPGADNAGGAPGNGNGSVYVYPTSAATPSQLALPGGGFGTVNTANDGFGTSVAISGSTIVVGAPTGAIDGNGAAYVFSSPAAVGDELSIAGGSGADGFGTSVAISAANIVVGASGTNNDDGAAYTYTTASNTPTDELAPAGDVGTGDGVGNSVAVSPDGASAGADGNSPGAADVFAPELSVSLAGSGGGSVTSADDTINCGSVCSASYVPGTTETLTAKAAAGSVFTGWSGACSGLSCTVLLNTPSPAQGVIANFAPQGVLTATISTPTTNNTYAVGQSVPTSFSCSQGADPLPLTSCTDSRGVSAPAPNFTGQDTLDTSTPGTHTYSVTAVDASNTSSPPTSITYTVVAAPVNQAAPTIAGGTSSGSTLTCSPGQWTSSPTGYTYVWERDGSPIPGATSATYVLGQLDLGATLSCVVTASNAAASGTASSLGVSVPGPVSSTTTTTTTSTPPSSTASGPGPAAPASLRLSKGSVIDRGHQLQFTCSSPGHTLSGCSITARAGHTVVAMGVVHRHGRTETVTLSLTRAGLALILRRPAGVTLTVAATGSTSGTPAMKQSETATLSFSRQVLIPTQGMFVPNSPQLTPYGAAFLTSAAHQIDHSERLICVGYTAAPGGSLTNDAFSLLLSRQRAEVACRYLRARHVSATYETEGLGKRDPLVPNTTPANLARNRRVEFEVTGKLRLTR